MYPVVRAAVLVPWLVADSQSKSRSAELAQRRARDPWRSRVTALFWGVAGIFAVGSSAQVASQLFWPAEIPAPPTCDEGLQVLSSSLDQGWEAARVNDDGPELALARFRAVVTPTWRAWPGVQRNCASDAPRAARLDALTRLRYALEARVRVEGGSLAALRRRALEAPGLEPRNELHSEPTRDR